MPDAPRADASAASSARYVTATGLGELVATSDALPEPAGPPAIEEPPAIEVSCSMAAAASCISAHTQAGMHSSRSEPGRQTHYDDAQRALRHLDEASARKFRASMADLDVLHTTCGRCMMLL